MRICRDLLGRIGDLTRRERQLAAEIGDLAKTYAPELQVPGVARLTAGKLIGEIAGIERFKTEAQLAHFAGCAPIPASSGNRERRRFDRHGNRQLNAALYPDRPHPGPRSPRCSRLPGQEAGRGQVGCRSSALPQEALGPGHLDDTTRLQ